MKLIPSNNDDKEKQNPQIMNLKNDRDKADNWDDVIEILWAIYAHQSDNLDETDQFLKNYKLPKHPMWNT
jgi:hypothetical protein